MGSRHYTFFVVYKDADGNQHVEDIRFKRQQKFEGGGGVYSVFLGKLKLGHVSWLGWSWDGWNAFSFKGLDQMTEKQYERVKKHGVSKPEKFREEDPLRRVEGFKTRKDAAEYLVQHWGFRDRSREED